MEIQFVETNIVINHNDSRLMCGYCRYSKNSDDTACGCPDWVAEGINAPVNEGSTCASSNPFWTSLSLPWLKYLKTACPTACEF